MKRQLAAIALAASVLPALAADPDPCRLLTPAEIAAALGAQPAAGKPGGPRLEQGVKAWHCDRQVGKYYLSVNAYEFPSAAAAKRGLAEALEEAKGTFALGPATGAGEAAAWGADEDGAIWIAVKGRYMANVTVAGELKSPQSLREPVRRLVAQALARLAP
ncbi:MAG: hypothetical protein ACT4P3_09065 [Betaproteobacteria bacterium]